MTERLAVDVLAVDVLAAELQPLMIWYDEVLKGEPQNHATDATGPCYLRIDAARVGDLPSQNGNHASFLGATAPTSPAQLDAVLAVYRARGVQRFFVQVSPCAQREALRGWLRERGLTPTEGTGYPTLLRSTEPPVVVSDGGLPVTELTAEGCLQHREALAESIAFGGWATYFTRAAADPDVHCFGAWDGDVLVGAAALFAHGRIGYLAIAGTRPSHRRRGAQSALIAARVARAQALGLAWCVSETLTVLESSLNNLRRAGFEVRYEKQLWMSGLQAG